MAEIKFLDKAGLTQVISHLQQDTDEKIAQAIEDAIFAGDSDENVDNLPYLDAEKLNGYTSDDFVKVADLGTTTVGLATADAEGNIISSTYAKNSDMNSGFVSLQSQIDNKVDKTTTVNGKALSSNIAITAADVGADAQGTAANALKEAKTYAEGQASSALTSAKAYTNTETTSAYSAAKTYAEEQVASALKSAKTYADTASATALSEAKDYNDTAYANANSYTDKKIADLINGAPTTLDTLGEIATAMNNNADVVEALNEAIGTKANSADLANYLPLDGSKSMTGSLTVGTTNDSALRLMIVKNSLRNVSNFVNPSGDFYLYDHTNDKAIIQSYASGTTSFNGTATENLPLSGGTMKGHIKLPTGRTITNNIDRAILEYRGSDSDGSGTRVGDYNDRMVLLTSGDDLWHYNRTAGKDGLVLDTLNYSNYALPITGGTINGDLTIASTHNIPFRVKNSSSNGSFIAFSDANGTKYLGCDATGVPKYSDGATEYPLLHSGNVGSYALPITGGTLNGQLNVGGKVELYTDGEGGNLSLTSPNGTRFSFDALGDGGVRFIVNESSVPMTFNANGTISGANITGNAATATIATTLARNGDTSYPMTFNWSGRDGQPTWLWGGEDGNNMYVYNPSNFYVAYANNSNYSNTSGTSTNTNLVNNNATLTYGASGLQYLNTTLAETSGAGNNAVPYSGNWSHIIRMNHANGAGYYADLSIPMVSADHHINYRVISAGNEIVPWRTVIDSSNIGSQSVNYANSAGTASNFSSSNGAGYATDVYGNFVHKQATTTDYFQIHNNAQSKSLKYYYENGELIVPGSTTYTTNQVRNGVFTTTDPGAGASSSYANGSIIYVYE